MKFSRFQKPRFIAGLLLGLSFAAGVAYAATQTLTLGANTGPGGIITLFGSTSGSATIQTPAAAGSTTVTLPAGNGTNGQVWQTDGSGTYSFLSIPHALGSSWAPGMTTLSNVTVPLGKCPTASSGCTITAINCAVGPANVGGTATVQVWFAASGTALSSGTKANTTDCNANGTANTAQAMSVASAAVTAGNIIGLVFPTGAGWAGNTAGSGDVFIEYTVQP